MRRFVVKSRWVRRSLIAFASIVVGFPIAIVLLYRVLPPPTTPLILGTAFSQSVRQDWVPLSAISPNAVKAVIATEDEKFCSHYGFDFDAIEAALEYNASGQGVRGASTISQQTAKNLFLPPSRTWLRKGVEAYFTVLIEALWPKSRIMETYLNVVELGEGNFGVEAAAQSYFGKPAAHLTAAEAARLSAVLPNPRNYHVTDPGPYVVRRTHEILALMDVVTRDGLDRCLAAP